MRLTTVDELRERLRDAGPAGVELRPVDACAAVQLAREVERVDESDPRSWRYRLAAVRDALRAPPRPLSPSHALSAAVERKHNVAAVRGPAR